MNPIIEKVAPERDPICPHCGKPTYDPNPLCALGHYTRMMLSYEEYRKRYSAGRAIAELDA